MPGRTFDLFPHSLEQERGSGAPDGAPSMGSPCEGEPAAHTGAASPTGAPPRCFVCTGPFFRTGLACSRTHDPGGIFAPPFRPVRKAAPLGALAAALAGRRRTSRYASQRRVCETLSIVLGTAPGSAA